MAETEVQKQGTDIIVIQSRWRGFWKKEVLILRIWGGNLFLRPRSDGIKLNKEKTEVSRFGGPVKMNIDDIVWLPWGGYFDITEEVFQGGKPIIKSE